MLLWFLSIAAMADEEDCRVTTEDYPVLRAELRALRRRAGRPLRVAGDAPECEEALAALDRNDPLLGLRLVEAPPGQAEANVRHSLDRGGRDCGAVLEPAAGGWWLREVGECDVLDDRDRHLLTVGTWQTAGVSARYNRELTPGLSLLADLGVGLFDPRSPREAPLSWGWMAGFDANHDSLKGGYLGVRGGVERVGVGLGEVQQSTLGQGIVGHRFVGKGATLQLGAGVLVRVPSGSFVADRGVTLYPTLEARFGLAR